MESAPRRTVAYTVWSLPPVILSAVVLAWVLGKDGVALAALLALPWVAWRYDNETGTFLPLSVLLPFLLVVLALLLLLMALVLK